MFTISISDLKNTMKVAKHTGEMECFTAQRRDKHRDISIIVSYYPQEDKKQDIYPYWTVNMSEEEDFKCVTFGKLDLIKIRDTFNGFMSQGIGESYLNNSLMPY